MAESSKRALHALLSISLFFFFLLVSFSSWLPCLLHHADLHLSVLLVDLPDCFWVDRKTMFVLCNLILVVIARDSGLLASITPERDPCDEPSGRREGRGNLVGGLSEVSSVAGSGSALQVLALEKGRKPEEEEEEEEEEEQQRRQRQRQRQQRQQQEEEEDGGPDMDELNKRFEDFIEKMKRHRQLEAMQMVMV